MERSTIVCLMNVNQILDYCCKLNLATFKNCELSLKSNNAITYLFDIASIISQKMISIDLINQEQFFYT